MDNIRPQWKQFLNKHFSNEYEEKKRLSQMTLEDLAREFSLRPEEDLDKWYPFLVERCDAEEDNGYTKFLSLYQKYQSTPKVSDIIDNLLEN